MLAINAVLFLSHLYGFTLCSSYIFILPSETCNSEEGSGLLDLPCCLTQTDDNDMSSILTTILIVCPETHWANQGSILLGDASSQPTGKLMDNVWNVRISKTVWVVLNAWLFVCLKWTQLCCCAHMPDGWCVNLVRQITTSKWGNNLDLLLFGCNWSVEYFFQHPMSSEIFRIAVG